MVIGRSTVTSMEPSATVNKTVAALLVLLITCADRIVTPGIL
jgi:hypothetical protein